MLIASLLLNLNLIAEANGTEVPLRGTLKDSMVKILDKPMVPH